MAEDTEVIAGPGAPASPSSELSDDQSRALSIEEIADLVAERVFRQEQSQADKAVAALRKELLPYLEDGKRTAEEVKQTTALVRAIARGDLLTEEQMDTMDKAREEATRIQTLEATNAQLAAEKEALKQSGLSEEEIYQRVDKVLETSLTNRLVDYAKDQGLLASNAGWADLWKLSILPVRRIASVGDEHGDLRYERESRPAIRKAADTKEHDTTLPTAVPAARSSEATQQDKSAFELFKGHFAKQQATRAIPR